VNWSGGLKKTLKIMELRLWNSNLSILQIDTIVDTKGTFVIDF